MEVVRSVHGVLGELLVLIYLVIALGSYVRRRQGGLPMWVVGVAHALMALQVVLGTILYIRAPEVITVWHPVIGYLALLALGLTVLFRRRLGQAESSALAALIVALLAVVNVTIAQLR